eukprot:857519-Lingulodinium_polyedra.AAC.1
MLLGEGRGPPSARQAAELPGSPRWPGASRGSGGSEEAWGTRTRAEEAQPAGSLLRPAGSGQLWGS